MVAYCAAWSKQLECSHGPEELAKLLHWNVQEQADPCCWATKPRASCITVRWSTIAAFTKQKPHVPCTLQEMHTSSTVPFPEVT